VEAADVVFFVWRVDAVVILTKTDQQTFDTDDILKITAIGIIYAGLNNSFAYCP
jgi:hypothetical protein